MKSVKGFTLIELMVTIAVLAIALAIAVPSFAEMIRSNRADTQREAVISALSTARSEAVKRGTTITVKPVSGTNWTSGWQVESAGVALRTFPALEGGASLSGPAAGIQFNSRGQLAGVAIGNKIDLQYRVSTEFCRYERDISINAIGRVSVTKRTCS
ncbi:GspH/FimT family pseudopilin [Halopseudomonas sp.]|uniref:GspH/FimT family pseudopilin n=1 Tax=Halopseudomonas sp. TaxID=2901191 RepID=UPI00356846C1